MPVSTTAMIRPDPVAPRCHALTALCCSGPSDIRNSAVSKEDGAGVGVGVGVGAGAGAGGGVGDGVGCGAGVLMTGPPPLPPPPQAASSASAPIAAPLRSA